MTTPQLFPTHATFLSALHTLLYVGVLYLSPITRPRPFLPRDTPFHIRARTRAVTVATFLSVLITSLILYLKTGEKNVLSFYEPTPAAIVDTVKALALTSVLFIGPLWKEVVENVQDSGDARRWGQDVVARLRSWVGWRNYVVAPITEEIVFRACIVPLQILAGRSSKVVIFVSPLYFGIGHIHHAYEFYLNNPHMIQAMVLRTLIQFTYTSIFGWYVAFLFVRTGSVLPAIFVHSFCNSLGVPSLALRSEEKVWKRWLYWVLLVVVGPVGFYSCLWPWTESRGELIGFG
ncbi:Abi-domain-containing protein [Ascodesmis nigricans]|uniref:intramembrane prenyl-peptidase Rce1 n=1 Tax=Ascodesmis nigricans TaxID=341454 RepID=A0A4S2N343_9PEZI|nr:Abi-domain-containing protein [Ascodesmis nigricans]